MNPVPLTVKGRTVPPGWAVGQRELFRCMERGAWPFVRHSTHSDGTLVWRSEWTSMDGTDNAYESFLSFPLFYLLGGGDEILELAQKEWDALTWQFTNYGTVERDFVAGFDWFHHSESYPYLYYLALAFPKHTVNRTRALRFAAMYLGEDPKAPNWDPVHRMIRSPLNGSRGPRFVTTLADWDYHRPILANYLSPFEDIPGADNSDPLFKVDWTDDAMFEQVLSRINERMTRCDVPLNLSATSLVTHAYIHTGEDKYKQWVLDYLEAWMDRRDRNGGILPDNIGPNGEIGELNQGKWWGGYYGWRWPHGARNIVEPALVAGSCALLMTGEDAWLDLCRSQLDLLWSLRKEEDGVLKVPARHGDQGWFDYRAPDPHYYIHLYYLSQSEEDLARLNEVFPDRKGFQAFAPDWGAFKAGVCRPGPWFAFIEGAFPEYPDRVNESTQTCICRALDRLERDDSDPEKRECYHFQNLNPVLPEALVQMAMGTPAAIYNGGLLQAHLRYFDPARNRPGLPEHVAAMVTHVSADRACVTLVNTDPVESHPVLLQAGCFGEHEFTEVARVEKESEPRTAVNASHLQVHLGPAARADLEIEMKRFVHQPRYDSPCPSIP